MCVRSPVVAVTLPMAGFRSPGGPFVRSLPYRVEYVTVIRDYMEGAFQISNTLGAVVASVCWPRTIIQTGLLSRFHIRLIELLLSALQIQPELCRGGPIRYILHARVWKRLSEDRKTTKAR
jgi:hypothetical protein